MRYRLRTLLIVLAVLPPLVWFGWTKYQAWRDYRDMQRALERQLLPYPLNGADGAPVTRPRIVVRPSGAVSHT